MENEVDEIRELLFDYKSSQKDYNKNAASNKDFYDGNQWTPEEKSILKKLKQAPTVINVIKPTVEQAVALLTTNTPRFNSTGREDSDVKVGKMFSDLLTYIWQINNGNMELKTAIKDYYIKGKGVLIAWYDPYADFNKGEIAFHSVDPRNVYIDPNSKDIYHRDAANILLADVITKKNAYDLYPGYNFEDCDESSENSNTESTYEYIPYNQTDVRFDRIDRYRKIKNLKWFVYDNKQKEIILDNNKFQEFLNKPVFEVVTQKGTEYIYEERELIQMQQIVSEYGNLYHFEVNPETQEQMIVSGAEEGKETEIPNSTTQVNEAKVIDLLNKGIFNAHQIIENQIERTLVIGNKIIFKSIIDIDEYPFFFLNNHWDRNPYPQSDVEIVKPLQRYVNKMRSLLIAHLSNSVNTKWWIPRGSTNKTELEKGFSQAGVYIGEYDPTLGEPKEAPPSALPNEIYKAEADARKDIQEILGIYPFMQGDSQTAPGTYRGTMALDEFGQRRIRAKKDDIESALNQFAKVIIRMIQIYYTEYKVIRLIRPDNTVITREINIPIYDDYSIVTNRINDVTVGKYDIVVVSGSMLPSNRWLQFDYYMELYKMGLIDQVEVLKKTEIVDTEGVLERFNIINSLKSQVASLQQELEQIKGDKQTTDRENLHLKQKVEVEKFKRGYDRTANRAEMATALYQNRLKDELKQKKEKKNVRRE